MSEKKNAAPEPFTTFEQWRDTIMTLVMNAVHQSTSGIVEAIHRRVDAVVHAVVTRIVIAVLYLFSGICLLVALAHFIATHLGWGFAAAYGVIGAVAVVLAALMQFANRRP